MKYILSIAFLWFICIDLSTGQQAEYVEGQILVRVNNAENQRERLLELNANLRQRIHVLKKVSEPLNIWLLGFDYTKISMKKMITELKGTRLILEAQVNHKITKRATLPNDSQISQQWQYVNNGSNGGVVDADIDADDAWDIQQVE